MKYTKIPASKKKSLFGTTSTERNQIIESTLPGPGSYGNLSTFKVVKSPKSKTTFGLSSKKTSKEVVKSDNLGPGTYASPRNIVKGGVWGKATRDVTKGIDMKSKENTGNEECQSTKTQKPMFTEKEFINSKFDWKWYRKQYHDILLNGNDKGSASMNISSKFRPLSISPTHNKGRLNRFGTSPRFKDTNTNPINLSSFKGSEAASVKQILQ